MSKVEDWQELLSNVASRNCRVSFRRIFDDFFPQIVGQGVKAGLSKELASELAQETMVRVWKNANSYDSTKGDISLWIYVIARNLRYDHFRKLRNDPLNVASEDIYSSVDASLEVESPLEMIFDSNQLIKNTEKLPKEQRDVIHKIYFEGLTQEEVALKENIPLGTVKSRVRLAIATLKQLVGGKLE